MKKLQQLHDILVNHVTPARINSWAEDIVPTFQAGAPSADNGFTIEYTASFLLSSVPVKNNIIAAVVFYLAQFDSYDSEPKFNTDALNDKKIDIMIQIKLKEDAVLVADASGDWAVNGEHFNLEYQGFKPQPDLVDFMEFSPNEES